MSFEPKGWRDGAAGGTPLRAVELNRIEQGIADAHSIGEAAQSEAESRATEQYVGDAVGNIPAASSETPGLMSPTHYQLVNGASTEFSNNTLVRRTQWGGVNAQYFEAAASFVPLDPTDLVTKKYVDDLVAGLVARIVALENQ